MKDILIGLAGLEASGGRGGGPRGLFTGAGLGVWSLGLGFAWGLGYRVSV